MYSLQCVCVKQSAQVNQVLLCGKVLTHGVAISGGRNALGVESVGIARRATAMRTSGALARWADSLRALHANVALKVNER